MTETAQYLSEFVCGNCARTGHVTWEGTGDNKRIVEKTENVKAADGEKFVFSCAHCGEGLMAI